MSLTQTSSRFQAYSLVLQVPFPLFHQHDRSTDNIAAAAAIQLEIGSGKFDFTLHGATASPVIVDHIQKAWNCSDGVQLQSLTPKPTPLCCATDVEKITCKFSDHPPNAFASFHPNFCRRCCHCSCRPVALGALPRLLLPSDPPPSPHCNAQQSKSGDCVLPLSFLHEARSLCVGTTACVPPQLFQSQQACNWSLRLTCI